MTTRISDRGQNLTLLRRRAFVVISTRNPVARNACYRGPKNIVLHTNIVHEKQQIITWTRILMKKQTVAQTFKYPSSVAWNPEVRHTDQSKGDEIGMKSSRNWRNVLIGKNP